MCRLDALQVDLDAEAGASGQLDFSMDDGERLSGQALAVLPDPMRIDGGYLTRSSRSHMGEHGQRNVEVIVGVRSPSEAPVAAKLRHPHRALHGPEMRIGQGDVDRVQLNSMLELSPVGGDHVGGRGQAGGAAEFRQDLPAGVALLRPAGVFRIGQYMLLTAAKRYCFL